MSRIRVLQMIPEFGRGGAERVMLFLCQEMDRSRFEVRALSMYDAVDEDLQHALQEADFQTYFLGKRLGPDLRMFAKINAVLRQYQPDVIHTHCYILRYVYPLTWLHRKPVVVHTMHNLAEKEVGRMGQVVHGQAFRHGVTPVAIAEEVLKSMHTVYGPSDYPLIPNGIPIAKYQQPGVERSQWRAKEGVGPDEVVFLSVGRLQLQKNLPLLLKAFAEGPARNGPARLMLAGDGPLRGELEAQVTALGLADRVRFLGMRRDIPDVLAAADVFVLSSDWEGNPLAVMEAMAAGKPTVSTAVGGIPELVAHESMGLLVERADGTALAAAMNRMVDRPEDRLAMGRQAAERARERFDMTIMVRTYERLYDTLLSRSNGRAS